MEIPNESMCHESVLPLFILPLAKPTHNGKVERNNRIFRESIKLSEKELINLDESKLKDIFQTKNK